MRSLRVRWLIYTLLSTALILGLLPLIQALFPGSQILGWVLLSLLCQFYFSAVLWINLDQNIRPGDSLPMPEFGIANGLTLGRMVLMSVFTGLLILPKPAGAAAWLPGLLYTAAALPDYIDGYLARRTNHVSSLGEILDMTADSIGVLAASSLAVKYGTVPAWYLSIGLARYLFIAGIRWREQRGKAVNDLPPSLRRRGFAALKMGYMFAILLPFFGPPGTHIAAYAFGLPFLAGFLWDWLVVSGQISAQAWAPFERAERYLRRVLPVLLRVLVAALAFPYLAQELGSGAPTRVWIAAAAGLSALGLLLGTAGRLAAITALTFVAVSQHYVAPLDPAQQALVVVYIGLLFLGTGSFSLWPVDESIIARRPGEPVEAAQAVV
jgi:CDP-diacylglycerol--glycerol-3-phosphate 3-phosphatidyltransferase